MPKGYIVGTITITDRDAYKPYMENTGRIVARYGGRFIIRGGAMDDAGFDKVRIVCSSGFGPEKCRVFALAGTPVDVIGTGSYLPEKWSETYATADIIDYDGQTRVKTGREFLIPGA